MKNFLANIGLGDGEGNTSSTRVVAMVIFAIPFMVVKTVNAIHTGTDIMLTNTDIYFAGVILTALVGKTVAEGVTSKITPPAPNTPPVPLSAPGNATR